jgi:hypothetical protein
MPLGAVSGKWPEAGNPKVFHSSTLQHSNTATLQPRNPTTRPFPWTDNHLRSTKLFAKKLLTSPPDSCYLDSPAVACSYPAYQAPAQSTPGWSVPMCPPASRRRGFPNSLCVNHLVGSGGRWFGVSYLVSRTWSKLAAKKFGPHFNYKNVNNLVRCHFATFGLSLLFSRTWSKNAQKIFFRSQTVFDPVSRPSLPLLRPGIPQPRDRRGPKFTAGRQSGEGGSKLPHSIALHIRAESV